MNRMTKLSMRAALAVLAGAVASLTASAHHSFSATYSVSSTETIEGTVVQVLFRNPHSLVHVTAPDKAGKMVTWAVEWGTARALGADNVTAETLKPGDKVKVTGNPARDAKSHRLLMRSIERPADGWKWLDKSG